MQYLKKIWNKINQQGKAPQRILIALLLLALYKKIKPRRNASRLKTLFLDLFEGIVSLPGLNHAVSQEFKAMAIKTFNQMRLNAPTIQQLPQEGMNSSDLFRILIQKKNSDFKFTNFAYVYQHSEKHDKICSQAFQLFIHTNALNPVLNNSIRTMEIQIISVLAKLFHAPPSAVGSITSCGTESLLLVVKTYRDMYYESGKTGTPNILLASTGHPSTIKGCNYFGVDLIIVNVDKDMRMDPNDVRSKLNKKTCAVFVSAPQYPHGVVDPVQEIAGIAKAKGVPVHVDAAIGGFLLPFFQKLGKKFNKFDFRVPGVTSISADAHKFGYCPKGCSIRKNQYFCCSGWPGGLYISPTCLGSRNGGPIAGAWSSLMSLGEKGFLQATKLIIQTVQFLKQEIQKDDQLQLVAQPDMSILAIRSKTISIYAVSDMLQAKGFNTERQTNPPCIHITIMPQHHPIMQHFLEALKMSVAQVLHRQIKKETPSQRIYGMMGTVPDQMVEQFTKELMGRMYGASD